MVTLRRVLGLALFATAAWLLTVLAGQIGSAAAIATTALLVLLGTMLWFGRTPSRSGSVATAAAVLLAVGVFALPLGFSGAPALRKVEESWRPLDQPAIAAMVERGNLVFVDVTADWCITCQVNKKLVLHSSEVLDVLERDSTVAMRGDWTLPDESITAYLASFNRYGIPFNAVYGPGAPAGIALPELLTIGAVLEAVERAGGDDGARLAEQSTLEGNR
jgi:suppressor for copper-sensitivity B